MSSIGSNYIDSLVGFTAQSVKLQKLNNYFDQIDSIAGKLENVSSSDSEISKTAKEFEGMFISQLLGFMYQTVGVDELFGGGFGEETFRSLLVDEYGKIIAKSGGIGIADDIQKKMLEMQGVSGNI